MSERKAQNPADIQGSITRFRDSDTNGMELSFQQNKAGKEHIGEYHFIVMNHLPNLLWEASAI